MVNYKFVVKPKSVYTTGLVIDQDGVVVQPGPEDGGLGDSIENGEVFPLSRGRYTYRFTSYGSELEYTIKIVDVATGRTIDGPESHKSARLYDVFKFSV